MKTRLIPTLACVWVLLMGCAAEAQTFTSADGDWWTVISIGQTGRGRFTIEVSTGSGFSISGFGYLHNRKEARFFQTPPAQLAIDFKGRITGTLDLLDQEDLPIGTIIVTKGRFLKQYSRFDLAGTFVPETGKSAPVSLKGSRMPDVSTVLTGQSNLAAISGKGLRSSHLTLSVIEDETVLASSGNAFPFYTFKGGGNVLVDGTPRDVSFDGGFVVSPDRTQLKGTNANGSFTSPELGTGVLQGNLMTSNDVRTARFLIKTDKRSFGLAGILNIPNSPIINVSPRSLLFSNISEQTTSPSQEIIIENIGIGILEGNARITQNDNGAFSIVEGTIVDYSIEPNQDPPTIISVEFTPPTNRLTPYTGTITLTGGGGATVSLKGTTPPPESSGN